jgi:hypothetical protein
VIADEEMVAESKSPLAPGEDGSAMCAEDDVHGPDQLRPALLHQHNLANSEAWGREHPPDCLGQMEGGEAPSLDVDKELQEVGPSTLRGPSAAGARRRGVATRTVAKGATSSGATASTAGRRGPRMAEAS